MMEDSFELYGSEQYFNSSEEDYQEQVQLSSSGFQQSKLQHIMSHKKLEETQHAQKETPLTFFQFSEQNVACKICYKYALNAVLCKNSKCSILFCGTCAVDVVKKTDNKCPFCRISPFQYVSSPFKSIINKMELVCLLCHQKYGLQEQQTHFKRQCCYFKRISCQYCSQRILPEHIAKHIRLQHQDKLDEILQKIYSCPPPLFQASKVISKNKFYLGKINKAPILGSTGKFYCGGRLQPPKCFCCNGYCGPSNGQNCVQCMKLDIQRFGLKKGYLVNANGKVCWKIGSEFICGTMVNYQNSKCKEGGPCRACKNMKNNIARYSDLL